MVKVKSIAFSIVLLVMAAPGFAATMENCAKMCKECCEKMKCCDDKTAKDKASSDNQHVDHTNHDKASMSNAASTK